MVISRVVQSDDIVLNIPAVEGSLLVVRLATSAAISSCNFDMDIFEDIKTAVNEACYLMMHQNNGYERLCVILPQCGVLKIRVLGEGKRTDVADANFVNPDICRLVLESLIDEAAIEMDGQNVKAIELSIKS